MLITKVDFRKNENNNSKLKGFANVYLDNMFVIKNIKLIEGNKGLFIAMPSRKISPEKKVDICNPLNQETRKMFEEAIIDKYNS